MSYTLIMSSERVRRTLSRLAYEVVERNQGAANLTVLGIRERGTALARAMAKQIGEIEALSLDVHALDVEPYRDDRDRSTVEGALPDGALNIKDRDVILVDDVLFTGRTARAALDAVVRYGRPRTIQLVVLIDRGHREYPIQPDYVGRTLPTKHKERVVFTLEGNFEVYVEE